MNVDDSDEELDDVQETKMPLLQSEPSSRPRKISSPKSSTLSKAMSSKIARSKSPVLQLKPLVLVKPPQNKKTPQHKRVSQHNTETQTEGYLLRQDADSMTFILSVTKVYHSNKKEMLRAIVVTKMLRKDAKGCILEGECIVTQRISLSELRPANSMFVDFFEKIFAV